MRLPSIELNENDLSNIDEILHKEWLLTNGLGGYASSTVLGLNTRKYHGLLVAALHPPGDRTVCLAKTDEDAVIGANAYQLNANEFKNNIYPQGFKLQKAFSLSPFPTYTYEVENLKINKTVFMPQEKNAVAIIYEATNKGKQEANLRVYPLITCRNFHSVLDRHGKSFNLRQANNETNVEMSFDFPTATIEISSTIGKFVEKPNWVDGLFYREEASRGESSIDDLYQPGFFEIQIGANTHLQSALVATADENQENTRQFSNFYGNNLPQINSLMMQALQQQKYTLEKFYGLRRQLRQSNWLSLIIQATNTFLVRHKEEHSIIAGYHWFETWGRDTFISLPGLTLVTGKFDDAKQILKFFSENMKQGLIPNLIPDGAKDPAYNTVDASLWYVNSVFQFLKYTGDYTFVCESLWKSLKEILSSYERGTLFGIHLDSDDLLSHSSQLTWMDAKVNETAVTPRNGKAVEIQALWYNALRTMQILAFRFKEEELAEEYRTLAENARKAFNNNFWNEKKKCLFDVINDSESDSSTRPNQIIALALDFPIVEGERAEKVIDTVLNQLLTPCGLRTLDKKDPRYRGNYIGNRSNRDQAYHNGTVWAWLAGPFTAAFVKTRGNSPQILEAARTFVEPLLTQQILQAGLGTISEIFDGDSPHRPRGCISQAWSVAEPLRAYVEDVMQIRPKHADDALQATG